MLYLILLPFILWYAVFMFKPMYGLLIAFKDYSLFRGIFWKWMDTGLYNNLKSF